MTSTYYKNFHDLNVERGKDKMVSCNQTFSWKLLAPQ